jgi:hypothetical protein
MAVAFVGYRWTYIGSGATVGVYLHGFSSDDFVVYCATPFKGNRPGFVAKVELTTGPVQIHVDGTIARVAWVKNQSESNGGSPTPGVNLNVLLEKIQR